MEAKQIIEINGVKLEVDLRHAKRIDVLQVGSRVKVLVKGYNEYKVHAGVVIGFEPFENLPSIVVAYLDVDWSSATMKIVTINSQSKDVEIVADVDHAGIELSRAEVLSRFDRDIEKKRAELQEIERAREFFDRRFGTWFADAVPPVQQTPA